MSRVREAGEAPVERRIVIADDFGQRIQISLKQLETLVEDVKAGKLDDLVPTLTG